MKTIYLYLLTILILFSCNTDKGEQQNIQKINPNDIQVGGIVHDSLTVEQITKITHIQSIFAEVYPVSLEETITNFKRDLNVDNEIGIWLQMADAYEKFIKSKKRELDLKTKKEVFSLILSRSMMTDEEAIRNSKLTILTDKEAKEVLSYYSASPDPIDVVIK